jgi:hypothetical protein
MVVAHENKASTLRRNLGNIRGAAEGSVKKHRATSKDRG